MLNEIIQEESKMHESLKKYKKDDSSTISDFEKMQVQFYMVRLTPLFNLCRMLRSWRDR